MFDSHCHFDFGAFDDDRSAILRRLEGQFSGMLIPGVRASQWVKARLLAERSPILYFSVGLHPWQLVDGGYSQFSDFEAGTQLLLAHERCVAIGECGLDAMIDVTIEEQKRVLNWHFLLAKKKGKPMILHSRKTHTQVLALIKQYSLSAAGVIHSFSGSYQQAKHFVDQGFYLGVGGTITYRRANKTRETIKKIPLEYLVVETDAPDMPLSGRQGQRNSPEYLSEVIDALAQLKQLPSEQVRDKTTDNAQRLFLLK